MHNGGTAVAGIDQINQLLSVSDACTQLLLDAKGGADGEYC